MSDVVSVLRASGLAMPEPVAAAAAAVGLELASAAALAEKESGARMVWGHDPVDTGGTYVKGGPVTVENYWAYRRSPTAGWQGVGICQLTYKGYIFQAEQLNPAAGAADPVTNCRVGFQALRDLQRQYGDRDGARRYNGAGAAAERYADDFLAKRDRWRARLAGAGSASSGGGDTVAVGPGDTLSAIAARWGVSWQELAAFNHLTDPDRLSVGQVIRRPPPPAPTPPPTPAPPPAPAPVEDAVTIAPDALARIVWAAPIEDLYTLAGGDGMPAFAALGWATAHAAAARRDAAAALAALERVETKLDRLLAALPPSST